MKTFKAAGNTFYISPALKALSCRGSANSETVCFKLNRYAGKTDLSDCYCTIKTKNREGKSDLTVPEVTADDKTLNISWTLSSGATTAAGPLLVQLQLEKIYDDKSKSINWQSNIMEFEITDSLDAANEIEDQEPTLFQQWEEKVGKLYSDATADIQSVQTLQNQIKTDADAVAQQKQSVEQMAAQAAQNAQAAAESARSAAAFGNSTQTAAAQARTSASDADTARGLAKGYSDASKTYSDAASVSAQSAQTSAKNAQQQSDAAQKSALEAQQRVDAFSGYTKKEINNGFANALIGSMEGKSAVLDDFQEDCDLRSLILEGTEEGVAKAEITVSGKNLFHPAAGTISVNGVTCRISADQMISLAGTASTDTWIGMAPFLESPLNARNDYLIRSIGADYTFSCEVVSGTKTKPAYAIYKDSMMQSGAVTLTVAPGSISQYIAADSGCTQFWIYIPGGSQFDDYSFRLQFEQSSQKTGWEPYSGTDLYETVPSAPLMAGDTYDLVSGVETHSDGTVFRHPPLSIMENERACTNCGALCVTYVRSLNKVVRRLEAASVS